MLIPSIHLALLPHHAIQHYKAVCEMAEEEFSTKMGVEVKLCYNTACSRLNVLRDMIGEKRQGVLMG